MGEEPFQAHASWRYNGVHIWGWGGGEAAPAAWLLRGFGARSDSPLSSGGDLTRIELHPPGGGRLVVSSIRLSPPNVTAWIGRHVSAAGAPPSDSLVWFGQIGVFATRLLAAGRVLPTMVHEHGRAFARWVPQLDEQLAGTVAELAAAAPPICVDGDRGTVTAEIVDRFVDAFTRLRLADGGWAPPRVPRTGRGQSAGPARARSAFASALVGQPAITPPNRDADRPTFDAELDHMHATLDGAARRARGEPVVVPRVRLAIPDDPHDDWLLELQLADEIDPGRWCTAADVWSGSPLALDLAGDQSWLPSMRNALVEAAASLSQQVDAFRPWRYDDEPTAIELDVEAVESFLDDGPSRLEELGVGLIGPEQLVRARVRVRGETRPDDGSSTTTAGGNFGRDALVAWNVAVGDGKRSHDVDDAQLARLEAAGAGLLHIGHRWVQIDAEAIRRAQRQLTTFRETSATVGAATLLRLAADAEASRVADADEPGEDADQTSTTGDDDRTSVPIEVNGVDGWTRELLRGLSDDRLSETEEPAGFVGELRHYQRRGLSWLRFLADIGLGGCLADDMGLGKTATTLAHLVDRPGPHLVVCPLSVVRNWQLEAQRFTPKLTSMIHHGAERLRDENTLIQLDDFDLVITTYGLLARDVELLSSVSWTTVVLDEAQAIKNAQTQASRAVRALPADQRLALTGTPIENRLGELWSILDAVNPGMLGHAHSFRQRFAGPIERQQDPVATARLRTLTDPIVLRRTKADKRLLPDLPDKIEQVAFARLTREQVALYRSVVDQLMSDADEHDGMQRRGIVLAALTRLKQICNHPAHALADGSRLAGRSGKLDRFDELISDVHERGDQALVFTQFREMGDLLQRHVRERFGIAAPFLHGGVSRRARDGMTARFQAGDHPLLLVSLKAGGTGLNLTAASHVIHYDRWWNPAVEDQATDRAWRLGQSRTVMVHKLVTEGTVEERIGQMIDEKRVLADAVIGTGEGESWVSELSTDELRGLVELDPGDEW